MANEDTIKLLKECNAGTKMAVTSIDEVLESIKSESLKKILVDSKKAHEDWEDKTHVLLSEYHNEEKEPNPIIKVMSWFKVKVKLIQNECDAEAAELIIDGCNTGIKSLCKYVNKYKEADKESISIAKQLIILEERLMVELRSFL